MGCGALPLSPIDPAAVEVEPSTASPRDPASSSPPGVKTGTFVIIGVIVAVLIFIALIIDVSCYFVNKRGKHVFLFCFLHSHTLIIFTVVWTNSTPTGVWRHFHVGNYYTTVVTTATTTTRLVCVELSTHFPLLLSWSELHVITRDQTSSIFFSRFARLFPPFPSHFFYGARHNKKKNCRLVPRSGNFVVGVIKKQQQSLSGIFFSPQFWNVPIIY